MRYRAGALVERPGTEIADEGGRRRGRDLLPSGHDLHGHMAGPVVDDDAARVRAIGARLAVDHRAEIAPGADQAAGDIAVGIGRAHHVTEMYCVSRNSISPSCAPSRPMPDCFMPPNGAAGSETSPRLRPIMPKSSCSETRIPRFMSLV